MAVLFQLTHFSCGLTLQHLVIDSLFTGDDQVKFVFAVLKALWFWFNTLVAVQHVQDTILCISGRGRSRNKSAETTRWYQTVTNTAWEHSNTNNPEVRSDTVIMRELLVPSVKEVFENEQQHHLVASGVNCRLVKKAHIRAGFLNKMFLLWNLFHKTFQKVFFPR